MFGTILAALIAANGENSAGQAAADWSNQASISVVSRAHDLLSISEDSSPATPVQTQIDAISAGHNAIMQCVLTYRYDVPKAFSCISEVTSIDQPLDKTDNVYFSIGANFYASVFFDNRYEEQSQYSNDPKRLADQRHDAMAYYQRWNDLCLRQRLTDKELWALLAPGDPDITHLTELRESNEHMKAQDSR